jgi:hypothetical protein
MVSSNLLLRFFLAPLILLSFSASPLQDRLPMPLGRLKPSAFGPFICWATRYISYQVRGTRTKSAGVINLPTSLALLVGYIAIP